jgi:hypothetical protein
VSKIDQRAIRRGEHTARIPTLVLCACEITRSASILVAGAFAIHGKATRKRTYVSPSPVPRIFVVDDEHVIASTLAAILKMNGFREVLHLPDRGVDRSPVAST